MGYLYLGLMILLTIINLVIFHSIFSVFYTDLFKGLMKEVVGAWLAAVIEAALLLALWNFIAPLVIGFIVLLVIVAAIVFVVGIIVKLSKKSKNNDNATTIKTQQPVVKETTEVKNITENNTIQKINNQKSGNASYQIINDHEDSISQITDSQKNDNTVETKTQFCVFCGKSISAYSKFCNHCGKENKRRLIKA